MGEASFFWLTLGGLGVATASSATWWYRNHKIKTKDDSDRLNEQSMSLREGFVVTTFAIEVTGASLPLPEVWRALRELADKHELHPIGGVDNIFMGVENATRVAHESVGAVTRFACEASQFLKDKGSAKTAIHCDLVPMIGLGSTVVLSDLWAQTLAMLDQAEAGQISFSQDALPWAEVNLGQEVQKIIVNKKSHILVA